MRAIALLLLIKINTVFADSVILDLTGNSAIITIQQLDGGNHTADVTLTGDGHDVWLKQEGAGNHDATVDLSNGGGSYDLDLNQNSSSDLSFSITGTCVTTGGCSVSVSQTQ